MWGEACAREGRCMRKCECMGPIGKDVPKTHQKTKARIKTIHFWPAQIDLKVVLAGRREGNVILR
jgi:hypothetical protein